jgi:two-component system LytT family response regulator
MTYTVLITDDERPARDRLRDLVAEHRDLRVVGECASGRDAIVRIVETMPDVVLLDVQMGDIDGLGVVQALLGLLDPDGMPLIVYVTAHDRYAVGAFEASALDYLLKPVGRERFASAMERVRRMLALRERGSAGGRTAASDLARLRHDLAPAAKPLSRIVARRGRAVTFIAPAAVDWIDASGNYLRIHVSGATHMLRGTMADLQRRLDARQFLRIHRSAIVNVDRIQQVQPSGHGEYVVTLTGGVRLKSSRTQSAKLREALRAARLSTTTSNSSPRR